MELKVVKGSKLMVDEETGLLYHPPPAKGKWPELAGYTAHSESKGKAVSRWEQEKVEGHIPKGIDRVKKKAKNLMSD